MTKEYKNELDLLCKWTDTKDKTEFLRLGKELFPQATETELAKMFEDGMDAYKGFPTT